MDHHCMWTNQCVGYHTLKHFFLFTLYLSLLCLFGVVTIAYQIFVSKQIAPTTILWALVCMRPFTLGFELITDLMILQASLYSAAFSTTMLCSLIYGIMTNDSLID